MYYHNLKYDKICKILYVILESNNTLAVPSINCCCHPYFFDFKLPSQLGNNLAPIIIFIYNQTRAHSPFPRSFQSQKGFSHTFIRSHLLVIGKKARASDFAAVPWWGANRRLRRVKGRMRRWDVRFCIVLPK